jgi:hypothetical protein
MKESQTKRVIFWLSKRRGWTKYSMTSGSRRLSEHWSLKFGEFLVVPTCCRSWQLTNHLDYPGFKRPTPSCNWYTEFFAFFLPGAFLFSWWVHSLSLRFTRCLSASPDCRSYIGHLFEISHNRKHSVNIFVPWAMPRGLQSGRQRVEPPYPHGWMSSRTSQLKHGGGRETRRGGMLISSTSESLLVINEIPWPNGRIVGDPLWSFLPAAG